MRSDVSHSTSFLPGLTTLCREKEMFGFIHLTDRVIVTDVYRSHSQQLIQVTQTSSSVSYVLTLTIDKYEDEELSFI